MEVLQTGASYPAVTDSQVKTQEIPLPPLLEQKRIVAVLDEAFEGLAVAVANAEQNAKNARELFDSYLNTIFTNKDTGWTDKTLNEVARDFGRGKSKHRPRNDPALYGGRYPFIQTGDVRNCNHTILTSSQTYNGVGLAQSKLWPRGTLCITIAANIAETGVLGFDACFPDSIIGFVADEEKASAEYVEYMLQAFKGQLQLEGKGSAQDNINVGTFENRVFPFPCVSQQRCIVESLNELSAHVGHLKATYEAKLEQLVELKQSLLDRAFKGE
jgi:type I restriction enzyme S subunit